MEKEKSCSITAVSHLVPPSSTPNPLPGQRTTGQCKGHGLRQVQHPCYPILYVSAGGPRGEFQPGTDPRTEVKGMCSVINVFQGEKGVGVELRIWRQVSSVPPKCSGEVSRPSQICGAVSVIGQAAGHSRAVESAGRSSIVLQSLAEAGMRSQGTRSGAGVSFSTLSSAAWPRQTGDRNVSCVAAANLC